MIPLLLLGLTLAVPLEAPAHDEDSSDFDFEGEWIGYRRRPMMSLQYGSGQINETEIIQSFAPPRFLEARAGGTWIDTLWNDGEILDYRSDQLFLTFLSSNIGTTPAAPDLETEQWRFGLLWDRGYGYRLGSSPSSPMLLLTHADGIVWSRLRLLDRPAVPADSLLLSLWTDAFRFGTKTEAGITLHPFPLVAVSVNYEREIIFRRHLFMKWVGSSLLEGIGHWAIDAFVRRVRKARPEAAPLVYFVLKNAYSYGVYALRKAEMNFPFESEPPLTVDGFKIGVSFVF
jgi:hypothetical protein